MAKEIPKSHPRFTGNPSGSGGWSNRLFFLRIQIRSPPRRIKSLRKTPKIVMKNIPCFSENELPS
jgi:hypothetical protein